MRNLLEAWQGRDDSPACRVIDSWHGEWRHRRNIAAPLYLVGAIVLIVVARIRGQLGLLHLNMSDGGSIPRKALLVWLGVLLRTPVIVHVHGASVSEQIRPLPATLKTLLRVTLNRARALVVLGGFWRDFFVDEMGVDAGRVATIPHGVLEPSVDRVAARGGPAHLLALGRLGSRKGTPEIFEALATPQLRALDWRLVLAGDGDVAAMQARAEALGIADRCAFTGWVERPQVVELLARADVLVLPSHAEGLPVAILEAMARGLAIVTTPVGAIEDAITDRETGLLVPAGDSEALAAALVAVVSDADLRRVLGHAAQARYRQEFTVKIYAGRMRELYRRCGL